MKEADDYDWDSFGFSDEQDIFFKFNDIYLLLKESFKEGRDHLHLEELNIIPNNEEYI